MKKFLTTMFLLSAVAIPANAVVSNQEIMSDVYIRQHGHSEEMVRLIDLQASQISGTPTKYKSQNPEWYQLQPFTAFRQLMVRLDRTPENNIFADEDFDFNTVQPVKFVRGVFMYLDNGLDDRQYMQHDINYTTRYDDL